MIVDTSALVAVLLREPGHDVLEEHLGLGSVAVGTPTLTEAGIVLTARIGVSGKSLLARLVQELEIEEIPFTGNHWTASVDAFLRYGKGRHPAALNLGDCFTYAVAQLTGEPLLCLGNDFAQTDLPLVVLRDVG